MLNRLKAIIRRHRKRFNLVCKNCQLNLSYDINRDGVTILEDIFRKREYADYFPFYEKVTVVDIGAHYGYFSIFATKNTDEKSAIYSVEPSPHNFKILEENLRQCNISNVKPFQMAIGKKTETGTFYEGRSINNSLLKDYVLLNQTKRETKVTILDLNTFIKNNKIEKIDFLKLDCEGAEYGILLNAPVEVFKKIQVLSMEFHDLKNPEFTGNRLVEKLKDNGFEILKYSYDRTNINLNFGKIIAKRKAGIEIVT